MAKNKIGSLHSTRPLDYTSMSQYERESLASKAKLAADKKKRKRPRPAGGANPQTLPGP